MSTLPSGQEVDTLMETSSAVDPRKVARIEKPYAILRQQTVNNNHLQKLHYLVSFNFLSFYAFNPPRWRVAVRSLMNVERTKPSFASIGAVRSGTSALSSYILQHPHVVLPLSKEITSARSMRELMVYFPSSAERKHVERIYGGAVTGYCTPVMPNMLFPFLMKAMFPDLRIVVILRNPVDRAFSHWLFDRPDGSCGNAVDPFWKGYPDFERLVEIEMRAIRDGGVGIPTFSGGGRGSIGYLHHSIYSPFLRELIQQFGMDNIYFVNASEFFADPIHIAKETYRFLELPSVEPLIVKERNAGPARALSNRTYSILMEFFRPYNEELYRLVGKDFGWERLEQ